MIREWLRRFRAQVLGLAPEEVRPASAARTLEETRPESAGVALEETLPASAGWPADEAHRLLLRRYLTPGAAQNSVPEHWQSMLEEAPQDVVNRYLANGLLVHSGLTSRIDYRFTVSALQGMLRERGLKVSGKKADLIERLIEGDERGMQAAVSDVDLVEISPTIRPLAEQFAVAKKAEKIAAIERTLALLREGRFMEAAESLAQYEARQLLPRGLGMDWSEPGVVASLSAVLQIVFSAVPARLTSRITAEDLPALRLAVGMYHLWGQEGASALLKELPKNYRNLDSREASFIYAAFARQKSELARMRADGFLRVDVRGDETNACAACQRLIGKTYPIDRAPELPPARCCCIGPGSCYFVVNHGDLIRYVRGGAPVLKDTGQDAGSGR